jgi:hypothetical protein
MEKFFSNNVNKITGLSAFAVIFVGLMSMNYFASRESVEASIYKNNIETARIYATKEITEKYIEIVDGQPIQKTRTKTVEIPLFDLVEVKDEDGKPVLDDKGEPLTHKVPLMKTIIETIEVEPAVNVTHSRPHSGFIAQEVEAVLNEIGKDNAVLAYDKDVDKYHLRYMELIAPLYKAVQELSAEIDILKGVK